MKNSNVRYAFTYRRISSHNQVGNNSLDAQKDANGETAGRYNLKIVGDYVDIAKSGTTVLHRTGYQKMMNDLGNNPKVKYIIVHNFDRLHRNAREQLNMIYELKAEGMEY